uniref:Uncharacterized protein n=1 Tax=Globisporangium ultimum (strain ATCC 200006 / CBS 805.95 / DAOM BR144) TaxID=431595 RepID=K3X8W0_GLOUD
MAIDRELRLLLEYARLPEATTPETATSALSTDAPKRVAALTIYTRLRSVHRQTLLPGVGTRSDVHLPELLTLLAEVALYQKDFGTAADTVQWFLSDCTVKNQFYCRIQLARAYCASQDALNDVGATKLRKVLNAVHFILLVLPIACDPRKRPYYDFLVYNASVTYWHVARQLMKNATFQFLVVSLTKIIDALKAVGERDILWLAALQLALVSALIDAKQFAAAAKTINDVVDGQLSPLLSDPSWASSAPFKAMYDAALRVQVHVGSLKDAECQKILPNVKKNLAPGSKRAALLVKLQCVKSSGATEAVYTELFQEAIGFTSFSLATTTNDDISAFLHSLDAKAIEAIDSEIIVEAGIHAVFTLELRMATYCDLEKRSILDSGCYIKS